ncbi:MAG: leucine-rich repeat protein, partial [Oscillospiraceae bacterium]|nr:leucine-rich repeat protein [Oscillospiraceae bacterium]
EVCEDGEGIRILSYAGKEYDLTIPAEINRLPVTEIGEEAFSQTGIYFNSIVLPDSIRRIGAGAFKFNPLLSEIDIPESVTEFGRDAFYNTKWLENQQAENPCVVVNGILIDGTTCESP